jgi:Fe-S cluster biosynthesis and repair protein YggX
VPDTIYCHFLKSLQPAMTRTPFQNALGERLRAEISQPAWDAWLARQTMLINENRLSPIDPKAREYLKTQMLAFLYEGQADMASGFVPPGV